MKKITSLALLLLLLLACFLPLTSCGFQYHKIGVISGSVAKDVMRGNSKLGYDGYTMETYQYDSVAAAKNALLQGAVEYLLTDAETAEGIANSGSQKYKIIPQPLVKDNNGEQMLVTLSSNTVLDACKSEEDVKNAFSSMQKSSFQVEWDLFYNKFITHEGYKVAIEGLITTLQIAIIGLLIGIVIGTLIALVKMTPKYTIPPRILSAICDIYVGFFRGTPMVVQLLIGWFILLPALGWNIDNVAVATLVFGLNSGAYVSEIMRSGIQAVDVGQLEAARALGLGYWTSMLKIVIPQGVKNILPTLGNEFIVLVKDTSIVSFIAVVDITKAFRQIGDANYSYIIPYLMLALVYLVIVMLITLLIKWMERSLAKSERHK